jgi:hypothetical protein
MKKNTKKVIRNVAIGTGIAAAVGTAAYMFKDNPKVKKVVTQMRNEIKAKALKAKVVSEKAYKEVAKEVAKRYEKVTHADVWSLVDIGSEMKDLWAHMKNMAGQEVKKVQKKAVKKVAKKIEKAA